MNIGECYEKHTAVRIEIWTSRCESDIDLFIIVKDSDQPPYQRSRNVYHFLRGMRAPIEIVVRTNEEVERSKSVVTSLTRKVLEQGKLLYG